jgi:hypothetical protein
LFENFGHGLEDNAEMEFKWIGYIGGQ